MIKDKILSRYTINEIFLIKAATIAIWFIFIKDTTLSAQLSSSNDVLDDTFLVVKGAASLTVKETNVYRSQDGIISCGLRCQQQEMCHVFSWNHEKEDCVLFQIDPSGRHFSADDSTEITYYMKQKVSKIW